MGIGPATSAELDITQLDDTALFSLFDLVVDRLFDTPAERHGPRIKRLHQARTRVEALFTAEVGAFDRELEFQIDARRSAAAWITTETKCAKRDAAKVIHRARQLAEMPTFAPLFGAGMIDTTKTDAACHARKRIDANQRFAEHEPRLARTAVHERTEQLAEQLAQLVDVIETERHDPTTGDGQAWDSTNELHLSALLDGVGVLNARFEPDTHSIIDRAITNAADRARTADDPRPWAQQRGDALAHICNAYLHGQTGGSNRPHLLVHTDLATLKGEAIGLCETDTRRRLPTRALARIVCDALISRLLHADGVVLDHGRAVRNFTPAQYRALIAQHPTCVFPDCNVASCECDMHHGDWYENGGPTDLINGYPTCLTHHNFIHHGRWTVNKSANGAVAWYRPNGEHYGDTRPRQHPEPIPLNVATTEPSPAAETTPARQTRRLHIAPEFIRRCRHRQPHPNADINYGPGPIAHLRIDTEHYLIEFDTG